jgi:spectinomycin phosphotransferase
MLTEPNIDKLIIQSKIEENYGFQVRDLAFIKGGEASWGYKVETNEGVSYFCKIHTGLTEYEKRFELTYKLFNDAGIKNIPHPIKTTKGELVFYLNKYPTALFNFIEGSNANDQPLTDEQRFALGKLLGEIHQANRVIGEFSIQEDFKYGNIDRLLETLNKIDIYLKDSSVYKSKTAQLLLENKDKILKRIKELEELGEKLRSLNIDFVICHSEPHAWNTMIDEKGEVYLIDWDDSLFAPKEKDLNMIKDDQIKLEGYKSVVGDFEINQEIIHYYQMEWNISEIDAWSNSLLFEDSNDTQYEHYLKQFIRDLKEIDYC